MTFTELPSATINVQMNGYGFHPSNQASHMSASHKSDISNPNPNPIPLSNVWDVRATILFSFVRLMRGHPEMMWS